MMMMKTEKCSSIVPKMKFKRQQFSKSENTMTSVRKSALDTQSAGSTRSHMERSLVISRHSLMSETTMLLVAAHRISKDGRKIVTGLIY